MKEFERIKEVLARIARSYKVKQMENGKYREVQDKCIVYETEDDYDLKPEINESI